MPSNPTALLINDDPVAGAALADALRDRQVSIDVVHDGESARACLRDHDYSGVIVDLAVAALPETDLPTVVLAGAGAVPATEAVKFVLRKPVEPAVLACTILGLCGVDSAHDK